MQEMVDVEIMDWEALSISGNAAKGFYDNVLLENAVMVFPGGMRVSGAVISSLYVSVNGICKLGYHQQTLISYLK